MRRAEFHRLPSLRNSKRTRFVPKRSDLAGAFRMMCRRQLGTAANPSRAGALGNRPDVRTRPRSWENVGSKSAFRISFRSAGSDSPRSWREIFVLFGRFSSSSLIGPYFVANEAQPRPAKEKDFTAFSSVHVFTQARPAALVLASSVLGITRYLLYLGDGNNGSNPDKNSENTDDRNAMKQDSKKSFRNRTSLAPFFGLTDFRFRESPRPLKV